jgi:membrane fusion protein (multidrug efflux system)
MMTSHMHTSSDIQGEQVNKRLDMKHLSLCVFLVGCSTLLSACNEGPSQKQAAPPPPNVSVMTAHAETVPLTRESVGLLASTRVAQVRARVAGIVLQQVYTEGTDVEQGQVLFQIDPALLEANLDADEAALARAMADAKNATLIATRSKELADKNLLATQDLDTALAAERTTAAAVKEARAKIDKSRLDLKYATVTAPIAGYAGRALVTEGALVGQDEATPLTTIEQINPIWVNFSQPVSELQHLRQGTAENRTSENQVAIILSDGTAYPQPGKLDFSDLAADPLTGTVSLRAVVPNPDHRLLPGMFVKLRITLGHIDNAFLLPHAAVLRDSTGAYVLVVEADNKVAQHRVQTMRMTSTDWIVTGDLADDDQVIVDGLQKAKPGSTVVAVPVTPTDSKASSAESTVGS